MGLSPEASQAEIRAAYRRILEQVAASSARRDPADLARLDRARAAYRSLLSTIA
ncbi:hypothetical protein [Azospira restricta]|uniref:J domain-containing protein n=1 Tax=Azospira restricta TaxID=404405 RepID=A0A974SQE9_9RHOO|nr:hypothetical protein [Azospira restricta]QRJ64494.1 hypothetical protein IWH25_03840 [Azospira restricta]